MQQIKVYLDHNAQLELVGVLTYEQLRGNATYHFSYDANWLSNHPHLSLSGDLQLHTGWQHATKRLFGCFTDALPDRWGRRLIDKREQILAQADGRIPRTFNDFDYLLQLDDYSRMGAFRFRIEGEQDFMGILDGSMSVPPLTSLREFTNIAQAYEAKPDNIQWVTNLLRQGSSLGGARPKANMMDENGELYIAKVPSIHDDYDVALWEHFAHLLAKNAGIQVAETRLMAIPGFSHHALLSKRFDRVGQNRVHTVSAMTLTNLQDGADASSGNGYLDIVDTIVSGIGIANADMNLRELYRRVAFSICIGNHDDHFRNHAFVLTQNGWTLSPVYDINPTNMLTQSLLISDCSCNSSLIELQRASGLYLLSEEVAAQIINEVKDAVHDWRKVATHCHISPTEQQRFAKRLEYCL